MNAIRFSLALYVLFGLHQLCAYTIRNASSQQNNGFVFYDLTLNNGVFIPGPANPAYDNGHCIGGSSGGNTFVMLPIPQAAASVPGSPVSALCSALGYTIADNTSISSKPPQLFEATATSVTQGMQTQQLIPGLQQVQAPSIPYSGSTNTCIIPLSIQQNAAFSINVDQLISGNISTEIQTELTKLINDYNAQQQAFGSAAGGGLIGDAAAVQAAQNDMRAKTILLTTANQQLAAAQQQLKTAQGEQDQQAALASAHAAVAAAEKAVAGTQSNVKKEAARVKAIQNKLKKPKAPLAHTLLSNAQQSSADAQTHLHEIQTKVASLQQTITKQHKTVAGLSASIKKQEEVVKTAKGAAKITLERKLKTMEQQYSKAKEALSTSEKTFAMLKKQETITEKSVTLNQTRLSSAQHATDTTTQADTASQQELTAARQALAAAQTAEKTAATNLTNAKRSLATAQQGLKGKQPAINAANTAIATAQAQINQLNTSINADNVTIKNSATTLAADQANIAAANAALNANYATLAGLLSGNNGLVIPSTASPCGLCNLMPNSATDGRGNMVSLGASSDHNFTNFDTNIGGANNITTKTNTCPASPCTNGFVAQLSHC